jgi:MFS family permease
LAAGLITSWAPVDSVAVLVFALVLLGLGWNLGLVSGTTLVTDAAPLATRARTQGLVDLGIALAGAAAGLSSGLIFAVTSYATLALAGGLLALVIIPIAAVARVAPSAPSARA